MGGGLIELLGGHDASELFAAIGAGGVTRDERARIVGVGSNVIERNAFALLEEIGEVGLCGGKTLFGGEPDKTTGFGVVLLDGNAVEIKIGETVLGIGVVGIGRGAHPTDRFLVIARGTGAKVIERGEVELADGIAVLGGEEIPIEGFA